MLKGYIEKNIDKEINDIFYNESFCNLVLEYLSLVNEFSSDDVNYLTLNGYNLEEFMEY